MKSLQTIQKTFRVFQNLTKIAMILSFVWAGLALLGMLCGAVWYSGGTVVGVGQAQLYSLTKTGGLIQMIAVLLTDAILALTDGTPFTYGGAEQIKRLGIRTIVLPLVAAIVAAVIYAVFDLPQGSVEWSNLTSLGLGIVLILASLIFRYGAELETKNPSGNTV